MSRPAQAVPLRAYCGDCLLDGSLTLSHERLADLLADSDEVEVAGPQLRALDDGHLVRLESLRVARHELCAVAIAGPRGALGRRIPTVARPALLRVGPYEVTGLLHGRRGVELTDELRPERWIALTEAVVRYRLRPRLVDVAHEGILVNSDLVSAIRPVTDGIVEVRYADARRQSAGSVARNPAGVWTTTGTVR